MVIVIVTSEKLVKSWQSMLVSALKDCGAKKAQISVIKTPETEKDDLKSAKEIIHNSVETIRKVISSYESEMPSKENLLGYVISQTYRDKIIRVAVNNLIKHDTEELEIYKNKEFCKAEIPYAFFIDLRGICEQLDI